MLFLPLPLHLRAMAMALLLMTLPLRGAFALRLRGAIRAVTLKPVLVVDGQGITPSPSPRTRLLAETGSFLQLFTAVRKPTILPGVSPSFATAASATSRIC